MMRWQDARNVSGQQEQEKEQELELDADEASASVEIRNNSTQDGVESIQLDERVVSLVVPSLFSVIVLIGFTGNLLVVLVVLLYRRARTATSLLMLNLALADLVFIVVCVPTTAARYVLPYWPLGLVWCKFYQYTRGVTAYASVYTLVLMAVDRYLAIVHPIRSIAWRTTTNTSIVLLVTWVSVCCANCPWWYKVYHYEFAGSARSECVNTFIYLDTTKHRRRVYLSVFFITSYAIPLSIICALYLLLMRRIRGRERVGRDGSHLSLKAVYARRRVMKMVRSVVLTFAVCWLPTHVVILVEAFTHITESDEHVAQVTLFACQVVATSMAYFNSCLNPVVYAFLSENFRHSFRDIVCSRSQRSGTAAGSRQCRQTEHQPDVIACSEHLALQLTVKIAPTPGTGTTSPTVSTVRPINSQFATR